MLRYTWSQWKRTTSWCKRLERSRQLTPRLPHCHLRRNLCPPLRRIRLRSAQALHLVMLNPPIRLRRLPTASENLCSVRAKHIRCHLRAQPQQPSHLHPPQQHPSHLSLLSLHPASPRRPLRRRHVSPSTWIHQVLLRRFLHRYAPHRAQRLLPALLPPPSSLHL